MSTEYNILNNTYLRGCWSRLLPFEKTYFQPQLKWLKLALSHSQQCVIYVMSSYKSYFYKLQAASLPLRDTCIVFEALRKSIGSLTVVNLVFLSTRSGDS